MAAPPQGVCDEWITTDNLALCDGCDDLDPYVATLAISQATDILYRMSGYQWPGGCSRTVRPCGRSLSDSSIPSWHGHTGEAFGDWLPIGGCGCNELVTGRCGCGSGPDRISLGGLVPIVSVEQIRIDGAVVPAGEYRIDDYQWLVRLPEAGSDFKQGWPCCQRIDLAATEDRTFDVEFTFGKTRPQSAVLPTAELACELAKACDPSIGDCKLPAKVQSMSREGVDFTFVPTVDFLDNDRTGLEAVDLWLKAVNPRGLRRPAVVWSPDLGVPGSKTTG